MELTNVISSVKSVMFISLISENTLTPTYSWGNDQMTNHNMIKYMNKYVALGQKIWLGWCNLDKLQQHTYHNNNKSICIE